MVEFFLKRPILSIVISILIVFLGIISLVKLPITQFPNIAPPEVTISTEYTGANAETVAKSTIIPLERSINGIPNMKYMSSVSGNDGSGLIRVIFEVGTDPNIAAINVQNRAASVIDELPQEVVKAGIKIEKEENAMLMYINIFSEDSTMSERFLYNFADINILNELKRVKGVGYVSILGAKEYAMRIWLKPDKMLNYNVSVDEIKKAFDEQNVEAAPGIIGENSDKTNSSTQYIIKYSGKYISINDYKKIPIKTGENGKILRIEDIADVELGSNQFYVESLMNGKPSAAIILKQLPGSNAKEVIQNVKNKMNEIKNKKFLSSMHFNVDYDVSLFLEASIKEVLHTLIEAFILVFLVVFIFLQDIRSTIIPALAVPVSLIGSFTLMSYLGFSLNLVTLFALVLSIGIVVDNAIMVVEAVHVKMNENNLNPFEATKLAMHEMTSVIITITLIMTSVFIPISFMSGPSGIFYKQFSLTMAIAIVLSGVVALTLTPVLCVMFLKKTHTNNSKNIINKGLNIFNKKYKYLENRYKNLLQKIIHKKIFVITILIITFLFIFFLTKKVSSGFIPNEDQGIFYISITMPPGSTLERTKEVVNEIEKIALKIKSIKSVSSLAGINILTDGTGPTYGTLLVNLVDWEKRKENVYEIIEIIKNKTNYIKNSNLDIYPPPVVPGYGNASGFEVRILNQTGENNFEKMGAVVNTFKKDLEKRKEIKFVSTVFEPNHPQLLLIVDKDKATLKGITIKNLMNTLQVLLGSSYVSNYIQFGQMYKIKIQALPEYRANVDDILNLNVKNINNEMVPLSTIISFKKIYGVDQLTRYNMYPSAELNGQPAENYSSSDAINAIKEVAKKLPQGYDIDWAGITLDEVSSGNESILIFIISLVFVYLLLAAQYENFVLPLNVIFSLPFGILGAFLFLWIYNLENNIYSQIAIIMLIGLLGKNAILIIEFAVLKKKQGLSTKNAALQASVLRLRPILMTSIAFIAGLIPLVFANGVGALGNKTIGSAAAGGMIIGTFFGIIFVPCLFYLFSKKK